MNPLIGNTHNSRRKSPWARRAKARGVSPIIATILLVAITVVLAAVLYVLISGLTGGGTQHALHPTDVEPRPVDPRGRNRLHHALDQSDLGPDHWHLWAEGPERGPLGHRRRYGQRCLRPVRHVHRGTLRRAGREYIGTRCWSSRTPPSPAPGGARAPDEGTVALNAGMTLVVVTASTTSFRHRRHAQRLRDGQLVRQWLGDPVEIATGVDASPA